MQGPGTNGLQIGSINLETTGFNWLRLDLRQLSGRSVILG